MYYTTKKTSNKYINIQGLRINTIFQYHKLYCAYFMIKEYEKNKNNFKYDIVLKMRLDSYIN